MSEDLRAEERQDDDAEHDRDDEAGHAEPAIEEMRMERVHAMLRRGESQPRKNHNTQTPTVAVVRPCSGDHTSNSHATCEPCNFPDTSSTIRFLSHVPAKNRHPFTNQCSAKKMAFAHEAANATRVRASAPAPKLAGVSASRRSPTTKPPAALFPSSARIAYMRRASRSQTVATRSPPNPLRTANCSTYS